MGMDLFVEYNARTEVPVETLTLVSLLLNLLNWLFATNPAIEVLKSSGLGALHAHDDQHTLRIHQAWLYRLITTKFCFTC